MDAQTIGFIGGGNMAGSLIGGLIADGMAPEAIWVADIDEARLADLRGRLGVSTSAANDEVVARADTVVLAVKPQVMGEVVRGLAAAAREHRPLLVSVAAGVREGSIGAWLGYPAAVVRAMPNTPALLGCGATALFANRQVSEAQRSAAESVLRAVGLTLWVDDEDQLDAVTALSGSGPAYYFLLMELMEEAGVRLGLARDSARMLTLQTALGAARMALEASEPPGVLRERVTSPGGTTERALARLREGGIEALLLEAITAARDRSAELGRMLGGE